MSKIFLVYIALAFLFISCNDGNENNSLLNKPPYSKLTDSIAQNPKNADLYFRRGSLLYSNNAYREAENDMRKAWELSPAEEYALGVSRILKQKNTDEAIRFLEDARNKLPNSLFIQVQLAQGYRSKGELDRSLSICNQIISQYPNNIDALLLKADILKEQNKETEAMKVLEQAYVLAPGDVELVHTLAFDYAETKNPKALSLSDSLIKADTEKTHAEPYFFKGVYYSNSGKYSEAIQQFDKAIQTKHNFIPAHINKGIAYYDQKKYKEAMDIFSLAARAFADEADPYYWMGKTQEATGNKQEAKLNYQRACGLDKSLTQACEAASRL
ncbi:MAG TPA: tetratricopeptide repeat protein [Flavisolibacter sp.]